MIDLTDNINPLLIIDELEAYYLSIYNEMIREGVESRAEEWAILQAQKISEFRARIEPELYMYREAIINSTAINLIDNYNKRRRLEAESILKNMDILKVSQSLKKGYLKDIIDEVDMLDSRYKERIDRVENINLFNAQKMKLKMNLEEIDDRRFLQVLDDTINDLDREIVRSFREVQDIYRTTPQRAALLKSTNKITLVEAIDIANQDFIDKGINSVIYKDGSRRNIRSYSEMVIRTNRHRSTLRAEASVREEIDMNLVMVSRHNGSCPLCGPWQGMILIDDVFQSYSGNNKKYRRLSEAVEAGLLHPNCRHTLLPYDEEYEGLIIYKDKEYTEEDLEMYTKEQEQRALERQIRRQKRVLIGSLNEDSKKAAKHKLSLYNKALEDHLEKNPYLRRKRWREQPGPSKTRLNR